VIGRPDLRAGGGDPAPAVSVVIAAFDAERYLGDAIETVLRQTRPAGEVIVVDDGSSDRTADIAGGFGDPVTCVHQDRAGVSAALNRGIAMTHGTQLAFLDADDLWTEDKLALQVSALERAPELDMVFGHVRQFHSPELTDEQRARIELREEPVSGICRGAMLIRRDAFLRVGLFAARWTLGEFVDWYARALDASLKSSVLPEVIMHRRLHTANSGIREHESRSDFPKIVKAALDRRRAGLT
jgi:glycosyltransferase involved in cell wall biosynthesis